MMRRFLLSLFTLVLIAVNVQPVHAQFNWFLQAGTGDGSVRIRVNRYGVYNDYDYDPIGALSTANTAMGPDHGELFIRVGPPAGPRNYISFTATGASPLTGVPLTSCTGTFTVGVLGWKLDQSVAPLLVPPAMTQDGMILTQVHTITNTSAASVDFDLEHFVHPHLGTLTGTDHGGGYKAGPPESLFIYDYYKDPRSIGMETSVSGGTFPATDRYQMGDYLTGTLFAGSGTPLTNLVQDDANADGLIDTFIHATFSQRRMFTLAAGAATTFTVTTTFGGSTYVAGPAVVVPKTPPASSLPDGTYAGSKGPAVAFSSGEGTFGNGGRAFNRGFGLPAGPLLATPTKAGPNGARVLNVAYNQVNATSDNSTGTGVALSLGSGLILAAGLLLAAKKTAFVG